MDNSTLYLSLSFLLAFFYATTISRRRRNSRLPPGPYPFPVIGNLFQLGDKPHRSLAALSKRYGPLMSLKLGSITTIVISSPQIAKEFFQTYDSSTSSRSPDITPMADINKNSMVFLPMGDQWRRLRKIAKELIFSTQHLNGSELLRREKVEELVDHVNRCSANEEAVNIGGVIFTASLNILSRFMFSVDVTQYDSESSQEFKEVVVGLFEVFGKPNLAEFFPILKPFDPQGLVRRGNVYAKKLFSMIDMLIDQRLQSGSSTTNDVLDLLLNLTENDEIKFNREEMRHMFLTMFVAGTDSTSVTLEWVMTELIRNPKKMEVARSELDKVIGNNNINIQESDISNLPYLQAVVKETLRLHPPGPLLVPHHAINDTEVQGFVVPKNAQIICNFWAIAHDPNVWPEPEVFMPERFIESNVDFKGRDFEFIPFGSGRRMCPGMSMAQRMLHMVLGSLIHKFDWKLDGNVRPEDMNMEETPGLVAPRKEPLMAIPIKL